MSSITADASKGNHNSASTLAMLEKVLETISQCEEQLERNNRMTEGFSMTAQSNAVVPIKDNDNQSKKEAGTFRDNSPALKVDDLTEADLVNLGFLPDEIEKMQKRKKVLTSGIILSRYFRDKRLRLWQFSEDSPANDAVSETKQIVLYSEPSSDIVLDDLEEEILAESVPESELSRALSVNILRLDGLSLTSISSLDPFVSLTHLYLQRNDISELENLDALSSLRYLNISKNKISRIPLDALEGLEQLEVLDIRDNYISRLDDIHGAYFPDSMKFLFFEGNPCAKVQGFRQLFVGCLPNLEALDGIYLTDEEKTQYGLLDHDEEEDEEEDEDEDEENDTIVAQNSLYDEIKKDILSSIRSLPHIEHDNKAGSIEVDDNKGGELPYGNDGDDDDDDDDDDGEEEIKWLVNKNLRKAELEIEHEEANQRRIRADQRASAKRVSKKARKHTSFEHMKQLVLPPSLQPHATDELSSSSDSLVNRDNFDENEAHLLDLLNDALVHPTSKTASQTTSLNYVEMKTDKNTEFTAADIHDINETLKVIDVSNIHEQNPDSRGQGAIKRLASNRRSDYQIGKLLQTRNVENEDHQKDEPSVDESDNDQARKLGTVILKQAESARDHLRSVTESLVKRSRHRLETLMKDLEKGEAGNVKEWQIRLHSTRSKIQDEVKKEREKMSHAIQNRKVKKS